MYSVYNIVWDDVINDGTSFVKKIASNPQNISCVSLEIKWILL